MRAPASLQAARAEHRPGHALPRAFAIDPDIYACELDTVWARSWLYAGASAQAPEAGDFFRFDIGDHSLVLVRDEAGAMHALHNTCRHRGMPVCPEQQGSVERWVCPYHQWSYGLDGRLIACGGMEDQLTRESYGLRTAAVREVGGLAFVWLGDQPDTAELAWAELAAALAPQGLDRARVAAQLDYDVRANWKLVWENNRECWHCHLGHPQYVQANFDIAPGSARTKALIRARAEDHARALGGLATIDHADTGLYPFPSEGRWWSANRTPLAPGFVTESLDGEPVAPPMGEYADHDVGTLRVRTVPNFWCHASADHAVLTRLVPAGPERTQIRVQWLVSCDAIEGRDYELSRLLPFWQLTSEQDWSLCEHNQAGVRNPAFVPGPYSRAREYNVIAFVDWYLGRIEAPPRERALAPATEGPRGPRAPA